MGGEGASLTARVIMLKARSYFKRCNYLPDDITIGEWINEAREAVAKAAHARQMYPRDFASTLICTISNGSETIVAHIGDGAAVARSVEEEWFALSWPSHGEYASQTYFITDDPQPKLFIRRHERPVSALVAFTDGIERLALDFASNKPHSPFFHGIVAPVLRSVAVGRDALLSRQLSAYLDSTAVNARTDDDKTLLVAVYR